MTTLKIGRAGTLSEANLQQVDIKGGTIRATGNLHLADGSDLTYAAEQFAAYVDSPDETFVPVIWGTGCPPGFDGFYRVQAVALGSTHSAFDIATSLADTVSTYASMVYVKGLCSNEQF